MRVPWGFIAGIALWSAAHVIGPPAPAMLWALALIGLVVYAVYLGWKSYYDSNRTSLLMWGRFYFHITLDAKKDTDNDRYDKRAITLEAGLERPEVSE